MKEKTGKKLTFLLHSKHEMANTSGTFHLPMRWKFLCSSQVVHDAEVESLNTATNIKCSGRHNILLILFSRSFVRSLLDFFFAFPSGASTYTHTQTEFRKLRREEEEGPEGSNASRSVVSIDPNQKYPPVSTGHQKKKSFPAITSAQMSMSSNCAGTHRQTHTPNKSISSTETKSTTNSHSISILFLSLFCLKEKNKNKKGK